MEKISFLESIGIYGWKYLEPVILAALSSEMPLLLIGKHGSAKSLTLEKLAKILNLNFRFYNASLINYDDLVGIPIPSEDKKKLEYISNPSSIRDAEIVFIDEINRTKVELQNKIFPIIYEKRIQGVDLTKLKYRWCAINPPYDEDEEKENYIGVMPLDIALVDRFPFIINVPDWNNLSETDKTKIIINNSDEENLKIDKNFLNALIIETKENYKKLSVVFIEKVSTYIITLINLLNKNDWYISSRRAKYLVKSFIYILSAYKTLYPEKNDDFLFKDTIYLHIESTLPQRANEKIDRELLLRIAKEAIKLSGLNDCLEKELLLTSDPIMKLKLIIINRNNFDFKLINEEITNSIRLIKNDKYRRALCLFTYLSMRSKDGIYASTIEMLTNEIRPIFEVKEIREKASIGCKRLVDRVVSLMYEVDDSKKYKTYLNNYLTSYLPNKYKDEYEIKELYDFFISTWEELHLWAVY